MWATLARTRQLLAAVPFHCIQGKQMHPGVQTRGPEWQHSVVWQQSAVWLDWLWSSGLCSERGLQTFPNFCWEFKLTTMFSLKWESDFLHSCKPSKNYLISIVQPAMWIIFCPEVKEKKIVSLDHCLPVESMPLTRPADKRDDIM